MVSPIDLTIELKPFAGASINQNSLQMFYQNKELKVDLLPRVRDSIESSDDSVVVRITNAEFPVGHHQIFIRVEDTRGLASEKQLAFSIVRP